MTSSSSFRAAPIVGEGDAIRQGFMAECIADAVSNAAGTGGPFAALIVHEGRPIARGSNGVTTLLDPTAHAEVLAIRAAAKALGRFNLTGCELFTSCEPCPMCLGAVYWARLDRVYFAATRFEASAAGFDDMHLYNELCMPLSQRSLPLVQIATSDARAPFDAWGRNSSRVPY
ncbi:MAG: nucleoside deaminase [Polyangiaceae bacterium]